MRQYHHVQCMFDTFVRARATTKIITEPDDIRGFDDLEESDQQSITEAIDGIVNQSIRPCLKKNCANLFFVRTLSNFDQLWKFLAQT